MPAIGDLSIESGEESMKKKIAQLFDKSGLSTKLRKILEQVDMLLKVTRDKMCISMNLTRLISVPVAESSCLNGHRCWRLSTSICVDVVSGLRASTARRM